MAASTSGHRLCHAGQLLKLGCHVEPSSWRRVCNTCMEAYSKEGLNVPAARCRYLTGPCGSFGGGRNFFVSWSTSAGIFEGVRALRLAGDSRLLLVFCEEATAEECERGLPAGMLQRITGEAVRLRLCAGSKSFCVADNFKTGSNVKTCRVHLAPDASGGGMKANKRPIEDSAASEAMLVGLDELLQDLGHGPIQPAPPAAHPTPALPLSCLGVGRAPTPRASASSESLAVDLPLAGTSVDTSTGWHSSANSDTGEASSRSPSHDSDTRSPSHDTDASTDAATDFSSFKQLDVTGRLMAHGETLKAGGSSSWTVVSDARLKDVVATFDLGAGELAKLRPKVFRYKPGLAGADPERLYVGLIAQEVPNSLARYCRVRARVRLRPVDAEDTEIYMLDHSCLQFVCINAVNAVGDALAETAGRLTALDEAVGERLCDAEGHVTAQGERLRQAEGRISSLELQAANKLPPAEVRPRACAGLLALMRWRAIRHARLVERLLLLACWLTALMGFGIEFYLATVIQPLRIHTQLTPFAARFCSFDAGLAALLAAAICSVLARVPASQCAPSVGSRDAVGAASPHSRRWVVWGWFTFALCATFLLLAKHVIIFEQYASVSFALLLPSPGLAALAAAMRLWRTQHGLRARAAPCPVEADEVDSGCAVPVHVCARTTLRGLLDPPDCCSPARASVGCIISLGFVGYFWLLATFTTPFSRLYVLPTDHCELMRSRMNELDCSNFTKKWHSRCAHPSYAYETQHEAALACIAAGCTGLAKKVELSRAWYPATALGPPVYKYWNSNAEGFQSHAEDSTRCSYGWVADDFEATWLWSAKPSASCGDARYGAKLAMGVYGPSAAYCTGCPDLHQCPSRPAPPMPPPGPPSHPAPPCWPPAPPVLPMPRRPPQQPPRPPAASQWTTTVVCSNPWREQRTCRPPTAKAAIRCCDVPCKVTGGGDCADTSISVCPTSSLYFFTGEEPRLLHSLAGSEVPHAQAMAECAVQGGRLCTPDEAGRTELGSCSTGCGYDEVEVWTSETCRPVE